MADNVAITAGSGTSIATDQDGGGNHHQYVKVEFGADNTQTPVDASNPLPVTVISGGNGAVQGVDAHDAAVTAAPVTIGGYASAAAPTNVSADGDAVRSWHLRNGAQCVNVTAAGTLIASGNGTNGTALRVTLASDSTGTVDTELPAAAALADGASNPTTPTVGSALLSFNGTTWDRTLNGNGTATKALRVTLASDSTGVVAATCTGAAAHGASVSGNPLLSGFEARTSAPTAVTNGQAVRGQADSAGKQVVLIGSVSDLVTRGLTNYTTNTAADVIAAAGAGVKIVVMGIMVTNAHATVGTKVTIRDGTTSKVTGYAAAVGGGFVIASSTPIFVSTANTAVTAICGTTGADVDVTVWGYTITN